MASINIGGGDDEYNRYKMPPVVGKVEGKGNGIKTRIDNCADVARALHRPAGYVCKFFGCELGALTKIDDETATYIVNGAFDDRVLGESVKKFIDMFVLCPNCKLPETDIKVKKNGDILQVCNACGTSSICDMSHKLCTFIVNNPPDGKKKTSRESAKISKADKRAKKQAAAAAGGTEADEKALRRAAKKAAKREAEAAAAAAAASSAASSSTVVGGASFNFSDTPPLADDDDDDGDAGEWSVDMSKEAEEARARDMGAAAAILERTSIVDDNALAVKLRAYIDDGKKPAKIVVKAAKLFDGEASAIRGIVMACLLDETPVTVELAFARRAAPILAHFGTPMAPEVQVQLCDYFDVVAAKDPDSLKMHPFVLKAAYDTDLLEEDTILTWYKEKRGREDVRDAVRVIVEWLENASEEDEGDDDEEDEDDDDDNE
jgi:translation initiation factor 5